MSALVINDDLFKLLTVIHKLKKTLQREKKIYRSVAFRRVGSGLTDAEFALCVNALVENAFCTISTGDRDAVVLTLNAETQSLLVETSTSCLRSVEVHQMGEHTLLSVTAEAGTKVNQHKGPDSGSDSPGLHNL